MIPDLQWQKQYLQTVKEDTAEPNRGTIDSSGNSDQAGRLHDLPHHKQAIGSPSNIEASCSRITSDLQSQTYQTPERTKLLIEVGTGLQEPDSSFPHDDTNPDDFDSHPAESLPTNELRRSSRRRKAPDFAHQILDLLDNGKAT